MGTAARRRRRRFASPRSCRAATKRRRWCLTGAFGDATVTLDTGDADRDLDHRRLQLPSGINNAHFHVGGPGVARADGGEHPVPGRTSRTTSNLSGSATAANLLVRADQGIRSWDDFLQALLGGQIYLNIHSTVNRRRRNPRSGYPCSVVARCRPRVSAWRRRTSLREARRRTSPRRRARFSDRACAERAWSSVGSSRALIPFCSVKLSVVMPCYNERATIREIVSRVLAVDLAARQRARHRRRRVDDGTRDILAELDGRDGVRVLPAAAEPRQGRRRRARHPRVDRRRRSSSRTPTSSTTRASTRCCCSRFSRARPTSSTARASSDRRAAIACSTSGTRSATGC